jgi:hypothetical protein
MSKVQLNDQSRQSWDASQEVGDKLVGPPFDLLLLSTELAKLQKATTSFVMSVSLSVHIMGLCNDPMCRKCGTEEETSVHILCECEALASVRHASLGSFFLDPEDIRELGMGVIWNFANRKGLL